MARLVTRRRLTVRLERPALLARMASCSLALLSSVSLCLLAARVLSRHWSAHVRRSALQADTEIFLLFIVLLYCTVLYLVDRWADSGVRWCRSARRSL